jgi:hypothetical protein
MNPNDNDPSEFERLTNDAMAECELEDADFVNWQYDLRHEDDDHDAEDFPF